MSIAVIHAPSVNLATRTTMRVTPVATAPTPLMIMRRTDALAALPLPVHHHARLGEREGEEGADGEERDEAIGDAAEDDQQECGEADQRNDAVGVEQAAPADLEDVRQIVVHRDGARETREVGVRGICREREHCEDRADGDVVEPAAAHDGGGELGEDALVAGGAGVGGADRVGAAQQRDAGEKDHEQNDDDGERPLGVLLRGLAEGVDAVRDGFDAGHGGASAGEDLGQKPEGEHRRADGQVWRLDDRRPDGRRRRTRAPLRR